MTFEELKSLKEGDIVICIRSESGIFGLGTAFTKNKIYIVGGSFWGKYKKTIKSLSETNFHINDSAIYIGVKEDNHGESNGWTHVNFTKANPKTVKILFGAKE
jgi:hypothetical protein